MVSERFWSNSRFSFKTASSSTPSMTAASRIESDILIYFISLERKCQSISPRRIFSKIETLEVKFRKGSSF